MKNACLSILLFFALSAFGQQDPVRQFINLHKNKTDADHIQLQGNLLKLKAQADQPILLKIDALNYLNIEQPNGLPASSINSFLKGLVFNRFEELISWDKGGHSAWVFLKENGPSISDVLLLVDSREGTLVLHIQGAFQFEDLNDLDLNLNGSYLLQKLPENRSGIPRA